jgi:hypothetical protein
MKIALVVVGSLLAALALGFALNAYGFATWSFFAPKEAAVQSNVFHHSQQYQDTQSLNLAQYKIAYSQCTTDACRNGIRSIVQAQYAGYTGDLSPDLQSFLDQMRGQ